MPNFGTFARQGSREKREMDPPTPDRAWFIDQVREHQARLRASIRALGVRAEAVDDFAQDTLFLAWQKRAEFAPTGEFGAWVVQIARRLVANERRKEGRSVLGRPHHGGRFHHPSLPGKKIGDCCRPRNRELSARRRYRPRQEARRRHRSEARCGRQRGRERCHR